MSDILSELANVATIVTGIGVIFVVIQISIDHERSRRTLAVDILNSWSRDLTHEVRVARKIAQQLTAEDLNKLMQEEPIILKGKAAALAFQLIKRSKKLPEEYRLEHLDLLYIRSLLVRYLNTLESSLVSWYLGIADEKIMDEEFGYLQKDVSVRNLVSCMGEKYFPATVELLNNKLRTRRRPLYLFPLRFFDR
ncbi:MAG: hypothetical protein AAF224_09485 [Pseudomonadota bacterium]